MNDVGFDAAESSSIAIESSLSSSSERRNRSNMLRERVFGDDDRLDEEVGDARHVVERDDVGRVEHADGEAVAAAVDRDELEPAAQVAGHERR